MNSVTASIVPVPHAGLIAVSGADAAAFLQAQLSRRIDDLTPQRSAIAAWHDARGKVRAVLRVLVTDSGFLLVTPASLTDSLQAALRMYVLRSRVSLEAADLVCGGSVDAADAARLAEQLGLPGLPSQTGAVSTTSAVTAVCVTPGCWYLIGPGSALPLAPPEDTAPIAAAEIRAGLPQVDARTTARYVPQMLNLDRLDALDFTKGCYPGQEVIARTQHLGTVKRRACAFACDGAAAPESDTPVFDPRGQRIGEVLRAADTGERACVLLAVVALDALAQPPRLGTPDGPPLSRLALPFE